MVKCFNSSKFNLRFLHPLQALFPSLKIDIFCRIVPLFLLRIWNESSWKNLYPANAVSHFENRHFLTHRPPARPRGILCVDTIGSPHRGILCVEKIGSVAPELQEWPGTPSKPVKSTNGPFYWLTRKRAPPCRWTLEWGDPRKNRLPARIRGWAGTATGGHIHVVHISHTHPPKELIQALRKYLLGKMNNDSFLISLTIFINLVPNMHYAPSIILLVCQSEFTHCSQ